MKMNKLGYAILVALGLGFGIPAQASVEIPIDPDGAGGVNGTKKVGSLDWAQGNALAVGVGTAASRTAGTIFTLLAQAQLSAFRDLANALVPVTGLGTNFEWTYVTAFNELITTDGGTGQSLQFQVNPGNIGLDTNWDGTSSDSVNFFRIYSGAVDASDLGGTGFTNGALILEGHILQGNQIGDSGFNVSGNLVNGTFVPVIQNLDQFGTNNYSGALSADNVTNSDNHTSVTGTGSSKITVSVDSWDPAYFKNIGANFTFELEFNTSQILAYSQTDPSSCFHGGPTTPTVGGAGINTLNLGNCADTIGAVNGVTGPNIMFQTDANNSFEATIVPEPGVLALLGISLLGLGIVRRNRRATT